MKVKKYQKLKKPVFHPEVYAEAYATIMADKYRMKAENYALRYYVKSKLAKGESLEDIKDKVKDFGKSAKRGANSVWNTVKYLIKKFWLFLKELWAKMFDKTKAVKKSLEVLLKFRKSLKDNKEYKIEKYVIESIDEAKITPTNTNFSSLTSVSLLTSLNEIEKEKDRDKDIKKMADGLAKLRGKKLTSNTFTQDEKKNGKYTVKGISVLVDNIHQTMKNGSADLSIEINKDEKEEETYTKAQITNTINKLGNVQLRIYTELLTIKFSMKIIDRVNIALSSRNVLEEDEKEEVHDSLDDLRDKISTCTDTYHELSKDLKEYADNSIDLTQKLTKVIFEDGKKAGKNGSSSNGSSNKSTEFTNEQYMDEVG